MLSIQNDFYEKYWEINRDEKNNIYIINYSNPVLKRVTVTLDEKIKDNIVWKQKILFLLANYINEKDLEKRNTIKKIIISELKNIF
jgi:hypothetical protein